MDRGRDTSSVSKAIRVSELLGQTECIATSLESLIRIASSLQSPSRKDRGSHTGILPRIGKSQGAMLLKVIKGERSFRVLAGSGEIALEKKGQPQRIVSLQQESTILRTLCQTEKMFSKDESFFVIGSYSIKRKQSEDHDRGVPRMLCQPTQF